MSARQYLFPIRLAFAALALASTGLYAADRTWDGGSVADGNWGTAENWDSGVPVADDILFFAGTTRLLATNNLTANTEFDGINFASGAGAFTLGGNVAMNLGGGITNSSDNLQTFGGSGSYTVTTSITIDTGSAGILFSSVGGAKFSSSSGTNITKTGTGTLFLSQNSDTFKGSFIIAEGTVETTAASTAASPLGQGGDGTYMSNNTKFLISRTAAGSVGVNGTFYAADGAQITMGVASDGVTTAIGAHGYSAGYGQGVTIVKTGAGVLAAGNTSTNNTNWGITTANTWLVNEGLLMAKDQDYTLGNSNNRVILNGGGLRINNTSLSAARTIELSNAAGNQINITNVGNSTIAGQITGTGGFAKTGAGTITLAASNDYQGATKISEGRLQISNRLALQNSVLDTSGAGTVGLLGAAATNVTLGGLSGATDLAAEIAAGYTTVTNITLNTGSGTSATYSGVIANGAAGMSVVKSGTGTQTLSGDSTYTGATAVQAGKLVVDGSIASSAVTVTNGGTIGGSGSVGALTIADGGTLAPGSSPGTLFAESSTWSNGGSYDWEILSLLDDPGTSWDLLSITNSGTLNLSGLTAGGYTINLITLSDPTTQGALAGFAPTATYTNWLIASASGIDGFEAGDFSLDSALFVGATGTFGIEQRAIAGGQGLFLTYTGGGAPIPEPGTWAAAALLAATAGFIGWRRRRTQTAGKSPVFSVSK